MQSASALLAAYDAQLRTTADTVGAVSVARVGPLWLAIFADGRGLATYQDLRGADVRTLQRWVTAALTHFRRHTDGDIEWKTRGHDHAPGLQDTLLANGFVAGDPETIMIGQAADLDVPVPLPVGVRLRCRTTDQDGISLWEADADGSVLSSGRLELVPATDFAGLWGGVTSEAWRGRGLYRALTAARAQAALVAGKSLIYSECTEYSLPILRRAGLVAVSTTTPYRRVWKAGAHDRP